MYMYEDGCDVEQNKERLNENNRMIVTNFRYLGFVINSSKISLNYKFKIKKRKMCLLRKSVYINNFVSS
jgi:hypothetical protein